MGMLDPQQQFQVLAAQRAVIEAHHSTMVSFSRGRSTAPEQHDEGGRSATSATCQRSMVVDMPWMLKIGALSDMLMTARIEIVVSNLTKPRIYIEGHAYTHQYREATGLRLVLRKAAERCD